MFYDRKVKYFDYIKDGERLHGAGFAKMEVRENCCRLQLHLSGLHMTDNFSRQVYLLSADREEALCPVELKGGRGMVQKELSTDNLCSGISYEALQAIRIPIAAGCELLCRFENGGEQQVPVTYTEVSTENNEESAVAEQSAVAEERTVAERAVEIPWEEEAVDEETEAFELECADEEQNVRITEPEATEQSVAQPEQRIMLASKWEQLSAIYPHIAPFEDERDYLKLGPEDFVVLSNGSYQLAHNSFLLHGYYNYRHLILARHEWRKEARYYIGVPGNFYEREKQVALMFGFESFECKQEPADNGTYGYYMIRVDL